MGLNVCVVCYNSGPLNSRDGIDGRTGIDLGFILSVPV